MIGAKTRRLGAALFVLLALSACSVADLESTSAQNGGDATTSIGGGDESEALDDDSGDFILEDGAVVPEDADLISPAIEFFSRGISSDERHNEIARFVSSCMQQQGWTYEPILQHSPLPEPRTVGELGEFRRTSGYGIFTTGDLDWSGESGRRVADRNHEYYSSLGSDEQAAYRRDLNGDIAVEGEFPLEGSCEALAGAAMKIPLDDQAVMTELRNLYQAGVQSPEYLGAVDAWRDCLSGAGFPIGGASSAEMLVESRGADLSLEDAVRLEIEVAVADHECRLSTTMPMTYRLETEIVRQLVERYPEWGS